ncbi:fibroblast growth factor 2 isoform X1 [Danio rerio]|uniref:Fibroblast growth factor 2 isoform X1 n=1 Tax=Danio rerio TaxID=7955 RepID=A0AC58H5Z6_DANRE|nr:fibroblast growth factor 2 isoform X1 [Danio rerio]|eukprot:XP_021336674.1 fibroblast growth factor 2 isoform X1 [Danio rerio]
MATGGITTLPAAPDAENSSFPAGSFRDPKRLYCKNGGYFLRINADGRVDGARDKSDPHINNFHIRSGSVEEEEMKAMS